MYGPKEHISVLGLRGSRLLSLLPGGTTTPALPVWGVRSRPHGSRPLRSPPPPSPPRCETHGLAPSNPPTSLVPHTLPPTPRSRLSALLTPSNTQENAPTHRTLLVDYLNLPGNNRQTPIVRPAAPIPQERAAQALLQFGQPRSVSAAKKNGGEQGVRRVLESADLTTLLHSNNSNNNTNGGGGRSHAGSPTSN